MAVPSRMPSLPVSPSFRLRPTTFDSDGEAFTEALNPWGQKANDIAGEITDTQDEINQTQTEVNQARDTTLGYRNKAQEWAENEYGTEVETGKYSAKHHSVQAEKWANAPENVEVEPGTGKMSAKHWATIAESYAVNLLTEPIFSESTTSLEISDGSKSLITDTGKAYQVNMWLILIDKTNPRRWMKGFIDSYDSETGALEITSAVISGEGTVNDWLITQTNATVGQFSPITIQNVWGNQQYANMGGF